MLIYDCEIVRCIPDRSGRFEPDLEYCQGWSDHTGMGISVIGAYDYDDDRYRVFCRDNWQEFAELAHSHQFLVGFNNRSFDDRLLAANGIQLPTGRCYDILVEIWRAVGLGPTFNPRTHGGYGLDAVCAANFGLRKSGHGAHAPVAWQRGRVGEVVDYCLNDIALTKRLLDRIRSFGILKSPVDGSWLAIRQPVIAIARP